MNKLISTLATVLLLISSTVVTAKPFITKERETFVVLDKINNLEITTKVFAKPMFDVSGFSGVYLEISKKDIKTGVILEQSFENHHIAYFGLEENHLIESKKMFFNKAGILLKVVKEKKYSDEFGSIKKTVVEMSPNGKKHRTNYTKTPKHISKGYHKPNKIAIAKHQAH